MSKTYAYIRVSTDRQTVENQRFEITNFAKAKGMSIDAWVEETVSGVKDLKKRRLGKLLKKLKKDDVLICSEISRLGRSLFVVTEILSFCLSRCCKVMTVKDGFNLGDDIASKVMAFTFGVAAEIERTLIIQRTKESLTRRKSVGAKFGRPAKPKGAYRKLAGCEKKVAAMLASGMSESATTRILCVHRNTLSTFMKSELKLRI